MQSAYDLIMSGKVCVVEETAMYNLETMAFEPAAAATHQVKQAATIVPLLQLTEQQKELIPIATQLYYDLLAAIHKERQEVHKQMTAVVEAVCADSTSSAAGAEGASSSSSVGSAQAGHARDPLQLLPDRRTKLQQQEALTNRLDQLLQKEVRDVVKLRCRRSIWDVSGQQCAYGGAQMHQLLVCCPCACPGAEELHQLPCHGCHNPFAMKTEQGSVHVGWCRANI
jgi:hypothetical protein